jgi:glycine/D-amino acid oxidase-like deaminating enzyme/nitrite reductase/ring-hydroxylating ferredoxin subunit
MNRDGAKQSLWQEGRDDYQPRTSWNKSETYDVLVIGGGITGLTTALLLQQAGKRCILAEAHNIGFGTSGGTTAHLNTMLDTPYNQVENDFGADHARLLAQGAAEAIRFIKGRIDEFGIDCGFSEQPGYLFALDDDQAQQLEGIRDGALRAGLPVSDAAEIPVPVPFVTACRFEQQAQLHPTRYLYGLAEAFEAAGGVILQHCIVRETPNVDDVFTANTTLGELKAKKLVHATHIPPGINLLHFRCAPWRSYALACTLKSGSYPAGLAYDLVDPYHYFRTQEVDGQSYLIVGGFDHKQGSEENTRQVFRELEAYVRRYFDVDDIAFEWSSMYFTSTDGLPYIGALPGHSDQYTGTGYGGNGLIFGTLAGIVLSTQIQDASSPYDALFSPTRIKPIAGFAEFVKHNAHVASEFIGKRFAYQKVQELAELAPGEGKLADWEGKKVALYKDEAGKIYGVDPVCPHAKCVVAWNGAEKSWDCPCHGARFAPDGALLSGPAFHGLEPMIWQETDGD